MTVPPFRSPAAIAAALATVVLATGCASFRPANPPLDRIDRESGYRPEVRLREHPLGAVGLVLAFSGGGTRAAAIVGY
jgi:NTE family protein